MQRYAADWRPRFAEAYRLQDKAFVEFVRSGQFPAHAATAWDGYCATRVAEAGVQALSEGRRVSLPALDTPPLYLPREGASL